MCFGWSLVPPPSETWPNHVTREVSRRHVDPDAQATYLASLDGEEQWFFDDLLPED